ncbi:MAG: GTP cyclohydrolase II [Candidatus Woesearchaeota archaeon]
MLNINFNNFSDDLLKRYHYCRNCDKDVCVEIVAKANLPSEFGNFKIVAFYNNKDQKEHVAIVKGDVSNKENVPVRLHSECLTGDALGSLRCDCRRQLIESLKKIEELGNGVVLYLRQEGRGIGLINKIKAYELQDKGYDTVEANLILGFKEDERDYKIASLMIKALEIKSIKLITNNPNKIEQLKEYGIIVNGRIPVLIKPNKFNEKYLETKMIKQHHMLDDLFYNEKGRNNEK